jgi:hypothetical protein
MYIYVYNIIGKVIDAKLLTNSIDQSCDPQENECYEYLYFLNIFYFNKIIIYHIKEQSQ